MKHSIRNWHTWVSVVLGAPLLLVGITAFFIAHEKSLGTKDVEIPGALVAAESPEIRSSAWIGDERWIGTKSGVFRLEGSRAIALQASPADEVRDMQAIDGGVVLAGKKGLWLIENGTNLRTFKDDCWQVTYHPAHGYTAACKNAGLLVSRDGKQWNPHSVDFSEADMPAAATTTGMPLSKLVMDLHTGKFFLGKSYEWIWIDLLGLACVGLGLTGLVMWMRGRRQRSLAE